MARDTSPGAVPAGWLPPIRGGQHPVQRLMLHWTAGAHYPSLFDRAHYHLLIDRHGFVHRGLLPIGRWPPHTRRLNTGSVGIALCGMAGAVDSPFRPGPAPITEAQVEALVEVAAHVARAYGLEVGERTVLTHCEVPRVYGIRQRGRVPRYPPQVAGTHRRWVWVEDISWLPGMPRPMPSTAGARLRSLVTWVLPACGAPTAGLDETA
jgi:hypothetical protein